MSDEADKPVSEFLDQSEIDRLLTQAAVETEFKPRLIRSDGKRSDSSATVKVEAYDFRNPVFLSEIELRRLRQLHEEFIRFLSARLSLFLRMEFGLKMAKLTTAMTSSSNAISISVRFRSLFTEWPRPPSRRS
ncbi:MAG: hypothetical protein Q8J74_04885, partial [Candidatus Didemnitutus sp.]|nr:hypothetical protein [Candidatus Didemnitutus sp.]